VSKGVAWLRFYAPSILFLLAVFAAWEVLAKALAIPNFILPTPSQIFSAFIELQAALGRHVLVTVIEIVLGFVVGSGLGILLGIGMAQSSLLERMLYPVTVAVKVIPILAIAPLLILWFSSGLPSKIAVTTIIVFFPVLVNTVTGLKSVDSSFLDLMKSLSATGSQIFFQVRLPTALPYIFASLKVSITLAVIGAIVGEYVAAREGLGFLSLLYTTFFRTADVFVVVGILAFLGIIFFGAVVAVEQVFRRKNLV
jgi:NitT/TauT family transport system permease protein